MRSTEAGAILREGRVVSSISSACGPRPGNHL